MSKLQRVIACAVVLLLVFIGWYIADPQFALLQAPDAEKGPRALYRLVVYMTYIMSVVITWVLTNPHRNRIDPRMLP